jgi:hypothetical protein
MFASSYSYYCGFESFESENSSDRCFDSAMILLYYIVQFKYRLDRIRSLMRRVSR